MKLSSKLIIAFLIVSALIGIIGMISSEISKNMLTDSIGNNSIDVAVQMLDKTDLSLQNNLDLFSMLSKEHRIQSYLIKSNEEFSKFDDVSKIIENLDNEWISFPSDQQSPLMNDLINNELSDSFRSHQKFSNEKHGYTYLGEVFVTNAYGANVAQTGRTSDYKQNDEVWWQTAQEFSYHVGPIEFDKSAGIFARDVSIKVVDDDDNFLGVIKYVINVQEIFEIIDSVDVLKKFQSQQFTLLNGDYQIVYSTNPSYDESLFLSQFSNRLILDKIDKQNDYFILSSSENNKLVSYTTSQDQTHSNWILIIDYDVSEILAPIENLQLIILSISGIVTLFSILFGIYISRSIFTPVLRLQHEMHKVEQGNFSINSQKITNDEIGELATSFEKMSQSIQKTIELEKKLALSEQKVKNERFIAIGELSARLAHDLKNPLTVIKSTVDILEQLKDEPVRFDKALKRVDRAVYRIAHQIDGVLNFVKNSKLDLEPVSLKKFLESIIVDMVIPNEIKINLPENDVSIHADKIKIESLFSNLIINAIQAMKDKGIITIRILDTLDDFVIIEFENDGPQIPEENLKKIFEPLFTTKQTGTGLGLASCKNIVEQHNGTISVTNDPVTFKIIVPIMEQKK